jgi:serine protease Do
LPGFSVSILPPGQQRAPTSTDYSVSPIETTPDGFGVFVSGTEVISHAMALEGRTSVQVTTVGGRRLEAAVVASELATALVLLRTSASDAVAPPLASSPARPGQLAVAVGRWQERDVVIPTFVTSVAGERYALGGPTGNVPSAMPVYTLAGELFAVADGGGEALPVGNALDRLRAAAGKKRDASLGLGLQPTDDALARELGQAGLLVSEVVETGPADRAGVVPGDVLVAIGETDLTSIEAARRAIAAATPGAVTTLRVTRGRAVRTLEATPILAYEAAALARRRAPFRPEGVLALTLFPSKSLGRAGVPPEARVLSVNGRVVTARSEVDRERCLSQGAMLALVRDGDRQFFAAVEVRP